MNLRIIFYYSLVGLFSPLSMLLLGLRNSNFDYKRWALILFVTFYGSVIFLSDTNDGFRHQQNVYNTYGNMDLGEFFSTTWDIVSFKAVEGTKGDLFIHFISFFVGSILKAPKLFFVFVSFVYGYFYAGSIMLVARHYVVSKYSRLLFSLFALFVLWKNIEGVNTVRTWTGLWVLFYAVSHYILYRKKRYLFLIFAPPYIHFSYFLMAVPAWFVVFFQRYVTQVGFVVVFALSFLFSFNASKAVEYVESTELGQTRRGYVLDETNVTFIEKRQETNERRMKGSWYQQLNQKGFHKIGFFIIVIAAFFFATKSQSNFFEFTLLNVGMMNIALANYLSFIFAVYTRSAIIGEVFVLAFVVVYLSKILRVKETNQARIFKRMLLIAFLFFIPFIFYKIADMIYYISIFVVAFPFIPWLESTLNVSIREFFGYFLPN